MTNAVRSPATPLRLAKREFTRERIFAAAREVFFNKGFGPANFEDIALAAGTKRSTVYSYFRDKDDIITAIAEDYTDKVCAVVARLPGPNPTREQCDAWIGEVGELVERERAPADLFLSISNLVGTPAPVVRFGERMMEALAERSAAFDRALKPGGERALAWAMVAMRELGWALSYRASHGETELARQKLIVASEIFTNFVTGTIEATDDGGGDAQAAACLSIDLRQLKP